MENRKSKLLVALQAIRKDFEAMVFREIEAHPECLLHPPLCEDNEDVESDQHVFSGRLQK
jgi:hypothetical protein